MRTTRVFYSDNGTLTDLTTDLADYHANSYEFTDFVATQDYLYIGNIAPFNHFYLKVDSPSSVDTNLTVTYWDGNSWESVVELIDETNAFKNSGFIYFVPDRNSCWHSEDTNSTGNSIEGLTSIVVYDKYWIRVAIASDPTDSMSFKWIGQKFSNDNDLGSEFPDLLRTNTLDAFESGKTDWEEQHVRAAEILVSDLISKNIIFSKNQLLDRRSFTLAAVAKTAEIIYRSFGDDYLDQVNSSRILYNERLNKSIYDIDLNSDGILNKKEMGVRQGFFSR